MTASGTRRLPLSAPTVYYDGVHQHALDFTTIRHGRYRLAVYGNAAAAEATFNHTSTWKTRTG